MTLVEVMLAVAISLIGFFFIMKLYFDIRLHANAISQKWNKKLDVRNIANNIAANLNNYQITFDESPSASCDILDNSPLPLAWERSEVVDAALCGINCQLKGRAGYVIQPYPNAALRGVYLVTMRITHPVLTKGMVGSICTGNPPADTEEFQFVVSLK